jgi:hypothetical protein
VPDLLPMPLALRRTLWRWLEGQPMRDCRFLPASKSKCSQADLISRGSFEQRPMRISSSPRLWLGPFVC